MATAASVNATFWSKWKWHEAGPLLWTFEEWEGFNDAWTASGSKMRSRKIALSKERRLQVMHAPFLLGCDGFEEPDKDAKPANISRGVTMAVDEILMAFETAQSDGVLLDADCPQAQAFFDEASLVHLERFQKAFLLKEDGFFMTLSTALPIFLLMVDQTDHADELAALKPGDMLVYVRKEMGDELKCRIRSVQRKGARRKSVLRGECKACHTAAALPRFKCCAGCIPSIETELKKRKLESKNVPEGIIDLICLAFVGRKIRKRKLQADKVVEEFPEDAMEISDEEDEEVLGMGESAAASTQERARKRTKAAAAKSKIPKVFEGLSDSSKADKEKDKWEVIEARAKGREIDAKTLAYIQKTFTSEEVRTQLFTWRKEVAQLRIAMRDTTAKAAALGKDLDAQGEAMRKVLFCQYLDAEKRKCKIDKLMKEKIFSCMKGKTSLTLLQNPKWFGLIGDEDDTADMNALRALLLKVEKLNKTKKGPGGGNPRGAGDRGNPRGGLSDARKKIMKERRKKGLCFECGGKFDNKSKKCSNTKCKKH